ncbi:nucleotidyl transferase AbiEii/AbiGii toxin family protein [Bifidobacterium longum]|uniref:nucleotidyl transferase AbiEii/AbiGii toxin family protein n=1 Tax=Bifidobacterium longum TaxID=216816 RepID=UPI00374447CE
MIPDGAYLKGGSAISLRYPLSESRVSRDIDTAYSGSEEEFEESFAKKLQEGWQGFAGSCQLPRRRASRLGRGRDPPRLSRKGGRRGHPIHHGWLTAP